MFGWFRPQTLEFTVDISKNLCFSNLLCSLAISKLPVFQYVFVSTDTQTDWQTDRQTDRHRYADRHIQTDTQTHIHVRQRDRHRQTHIDRETDRETDRQTDRQTDRYMEMRWLIVRSTTCFCRGSMDEWKLSRTKSYQNKVYQWSRRICSKCGNSRCTSWTKW